MSELNHEALRVEITIKNGSPIREPKHLIHLDALLAYAKVQRSMAEGADDFSAQEELPLAQIEHKDATHPAWAASAFVYQPLMKELRYWSRKTNVEAIAQAQGVKLLAMRGDKVDTGSGVWKGYSEFEPLIHTRKLTAWCVGDKERIIDLLSDIRFIGKRRSKGYGEVQEVRVVVDASARAKVKYRVLTWQESPAYAPMRCGTKPPYFETHPGFYPSSAVFSQIEAQL